jgi:hypothetical protein
MANINRSRQERRENAENESAENAENAEDVVTAHAVIPHLAGNAAEKAAIKELKIVKLEMELATAKLAHIRAIVALEAAKSEKDIAHVKPSFSTRIEKSETKVLKHIKVRPPSYWKRLKRREEMREEAEKAKNVTVREYHNENEMNEKGAKKIDNKKTNDAAKAANENSVVTNDCEMVAVDDVSASEAQLINDVGVSKAQPIVESQLKLAQPDMDHCKTQPIVESQLKLAQPDVDWVEMYLKKSQALHNKWKKGATGKGL